MTFQRFGRSHHLCIRSAEDLSLACKLDEAHWVAIGAPISTMAGDETFLRLVDSDHNGRIMCAEVREAIEWLLGKLPDRAGIDERSMSLRLDAVSTDDGEGQRIAQSARKMLARLDLSDRGEITLSQVRQIKAKVEAMPVSEAGVVLPEAAGDRKLRRFLQDVLDTVGGADHPSGSPGVGAEQLAKFLTMAAEAVGWHAQAQLPDGQDRSDIMPLGEGTPAAYAALSAVRAKLDQYFAQCEAVALDERLAARMGWSDQELAELDFRDPAAIEQVLSEAPLAPGRADRTLRLDGPLNPYYAPAMERFAAEVLTPVLGGAQSLSAAQWQGVKACFAAHEAWVAAGPDPRLRALGVEKLWDYLDDPYAAGVRELIDESARTAFDLDNIRLTERLILYQAHMLALANNFVSFPDLYDPAKRAMFEMGSLVMDGRRFNLAVRVDDRKQHANIARTSDMCLLYVEVRPRDGAKPYEVAVPVTAGGVGNLCLQKRGIFHDRGGRECDAVVVSIIENPISLAEAFAAPFRRLAKLVTGKIESLTAKAEKTLDQQAAVVMDQAAGPPARPKAAKSSALQSGGLIMGFGVAGAAVGSALAYIAKTVSENPAAIVVGLGIAVLLVILPTSIVAWLKLRGRDLSAILEGSGWAINARMRLTRRQGRYFTLRPKYPQGARGVHHVPWGAIVAVVVLLAALLGAAELLRRHLSTPATTQPASRK